MIVSYARAVAQPSRQMERMQREPSAVLLDRGRQWLARGTAADADSALLCFSVVSARYDGDAPTADKQAAASAAIGKWLVYFSYHFDYPKAYEAIQEAIEICRREGLDPSRAQVSLGGMLQMMADQGGSDELYKQAVDLYATGFREAVKRKNLATADMAFINLITASRSMGSTDTLHRLWRIYERMGEGQADVRRRFTKSLYRNMYASDGATVDLRLDSLKSALTRVPVEPEYLRLRFIGLKTAAQMAMDGGRPDEALQLAAEARDLARDHAIRDGEVEAVLMMSEIYKAQGQTAQAAQAYDEYLRLKDAMLSSRSIQRLDELRFLADIREQDRRLSEAKADHKRQQLIILFLALLAVVTAVFVWIVVRANRRLRRTNDALYEQFRSSVASEERERTLCAATPQRQGPPLQERERILTGLMKTVATPDVVCSPDCSVARLAEHVNCSPKYLSQIINDEYGCNFNTFINGYRIREAARRLTSDGEWSRLTIEAIANSVGFRSRSTFVNLFKQTTGLTPSEYRKRGSQHEQAAGE